MGLEERIPGKDNNTENNKAWTICLHAFSDLSHTSPVVFLYLLKECYICGTLTATKKFRALQHQVHQGLYSAPQPGPATFIARCLYVLPVYEAHSDGFSHLIISALRRFLKIGTTSEDSSQAKELAAQIYLDVVGGIVNYDEGIVVKLLEIFDVQLVNIEKFTCNAETKNNSNFNTGKMIVEQYIFGLVESQSYMNAVTLLEQFSIRQSGQSFLLKMMQEKEFKAAEKWATFMGKSMLCVLVQEYIDLKLVKNAYEIIKKNGLQQEFPDVYFKCKESLLKKLAEKGCWDIAEQRTRSDRQLVEYLVYLAMEAGYSEKVDELCDRYSLEGFVKAKGPEASLVHSRYLQLNELLIEDIIWVDEVNGLLNATNHIEGCKVVGLDCEWKPNYEKGSRQNKVSIMQIASEKMVFILDLIKLHEDVPDTLEHCLAQILHSPRILKLGYNFQCDIKQLAHSYGDLKCFKHYEMLLDIQNVFKEPRGGLSGLTMKILGVGLNKTRRNSNWEQRPLSKNQLEYAALDAAVLIHIFSHVRSHSQPTNITGEPTKIEWKSYLISHMDKQRKSKKELENKEAETMTEEELSEPKLT